MLLSPEAGNLWMISSSRRWPVSELSPQSSFVHSQPHRYAAPERLQPADADAAAAVVHAAFRAEFPGALWLPGGPQDRSFWRDTLFRACQVWGVRDGDALAGVIAFRDGWVDHLAVLPRAQRRGLGGSLIGLAQARLPILSVRISPCSPSAKAFLAGRGFLSVGTGLSPDECVFRWRRG